MPAFVLNHILGGGGFSAKLMEEVREKRGLAYSVYSYIQPYQHTSILTGSVATKNESMAESLDIIRGELKKMAEQGPSEDDLDAAKKYLVGSYALRFDTDAKIASPASRAAAGRVRPGLCRQPQQDDRGDHPRRREARRQASAERRWPDRDSGRQARKHEADRRGRDDTKAGLIDRPKPALIEPGLTPLEASSGYNVSGAHGHGARRDFAAAIANRSTAASIRRSAHTGSRTAALGHWLERIEPHIEALRADYRERRLPLLRIAEETSDLDAARGGARILSRRRQDDPLFRYRRLEPRRPDAGAACRLEHSRRRRCGAAEAATHALLRQSRRHDARRRAAGARSSGDAICRDVEVGRHGGNAGAGDRGAVGGKGCRARSANPEIVSRHHGTRKARQGERAARSFCKPWHPDARASHRHRRAVLVPHQRRADAGLGARARL